LKVALGWVISTWRRGERELREEEGEKDGRRETRRQNWRRGRAKRKKKGESMRFFARRVSLSLFVVRSLARARKAQERTLFSSLGRRKREEEKREGEKRSGSRVDQSKKAK
jgi:hypothetical protein